MGEDRTVRERILEILLESDKPLTAEELAVRLGYGVAESSRIAWDLLHASRTLRRKTNNKLSIVMIPPRCKSCGYIFRDRSKPTKPSKCPRCRSERIDPPAFAIRQLY